MTASLVPHRDAVHKPPLSCQPFCPALEVRRALACAPPLDGPDPGRMLAVVATPHASALLFRAALGGGPAGPGRCLPVVQATAVGLSGGSTWEPDISIVGGRHLSGGDIAVLPLSRTSPRGVGTPDKVRRLWPALPQCGH